MEATIVMATILFILFAIFYSFMIMYQNVVIMNAASYAASEGALQWSQDANLYRHLAELNSGNVAGKKENVKQLALRKLSGGIFSSDYTTVSVDFKNAWGERNIIVEIRQKIVVPFSGIAKFFNDGKDFELKAKAKANIAEPTEYIRNIDYSLEWVTTISEWLGEKVKGNDAVSKVLDVLKKLGL